MRYVEAFEVAEIVVKHRSALGFKFPDGIVRDLALELVDASAWEEIADRAEAYMRPIERLSASKWDGSIG